MVEAHDAYPLKTVSRLTGLSPDIIRAWEKRYGVVSPVRGARGARLYDRREIDHLRLLARVVKGGRAIGDIAKLDHEQLEVLAAQADESPAVDAFETAATGGSLVERALEAVESYDEASLNTVLADCIAFFGPERFVKDVCAPLVTTVGERWHEGKLSIAQEHMATAAVSRILHTAISSRSAAREPRVLLATPSGEQHEAGLLMASLILHEQGLGVVYLGRDLPAEEICAAAESMQVAAVGLSITAVQKGSDIVRDISAIQRALPVTTELWLGGDGVAEIADELRSARTYVFSDLDALKSRAVRLVEASMDRQ